jgi:hypothetical protein
MKKCPYCGLENPDETSKCQTCQTDLDVSASAPLDLKPLKRFLPYFLSYLIVTSAGFLYSHVMAHHSGTPFPAHFVLLNTSLPADELAAKLAQVGVPREAVLDAPFKVSLGWTLAHYFALYAVTLSIFAVLIHFFKRIFSHEKPAA